MKQLSCTIWTILGLIILGFINPTPAFALDRPLAVVSEVAGAAKQQTLLRRAWSLLRPRMKVRMGTLIYVAEDSYLRLCELNSDKMEIPKPEYYEIGGFSLERFKVIDRQPCPKGVQAIQISGPAVFRLSSKWLRSLEVRTDYVKEVATSFEANTPPDAEMDLDVADKDLEFSTAWSTTLAVMSSTEFSKKIFRNVYKKMSNSSTKDQKGGEIKLSRPFDSLRITNPNEDTTITAKDLPSKVKIRWANAEKDVEHGEKLYIRMQRPSSKVPETINIGAEDYYALTVFEEGIYTVWLSKVSPDSADPRPFESKKVKFLVQRDKTFTKNTSIAEKVKHRDEDWSTESTWNLIPKFDTVFITSSDSVLVTFAAHEEIFEKSSRNILMKLEKTSGTFAGNELSELLVIDRKPRSVVATLSPNGTQVRLSKGNYRWTAELQINQKVLATSARNFSIVGTAGNWAKDLHQNWIAAQPGERRTIEVNTEGLH